MKKGKEKAETAQRWIKRSVSSGKFIYYDRMSGKIVHPTDTPGIMLEKDVKSSAAFHPLAPLKVYLDLSYRCNFECMHCITSSHPDYDTSKELETKRILEIIEELAGIGVLEIAVGGGEPLIHKDCLTIFKAIVESDMNLVITTNGSAITPQLAESLSALKPLDVRVSFDGGPKLHETVRGKGCYQKAILGLTKLVSAGIACSARLTLSKGGDEEIPVLVDNLANIGVKRIKVALTKPVGRAATKGRHLVRAIETGETSAWPMKLGLEKGMLVELSSEDFMMAASLPIVDSKLRVIAPHCGAGFETAHISANGDVNACVSMLAHTFGELHTASFSEVWLGSVASKYRDWARKRGEQRICDACEKRE